MGALLAQPPINHWGPDEIRNNLIKSLPFQIRHRPERHPRRKCAKRFVRLPTQRIDMLQVNC